MMAPTLEALLDRAAGICMRETALSSETAESFLSEFSLDFIFTAFETEGLEENERLTVAQALSKVFAAVDVTPLLPKLLDYATLALGARDHSVKLLGVEQLERLCTTTSSEIQSRAVGALFTALQDEETSVGVAAGQGLLQYFRQDANLAFLTGRHASALLQTLRHRNAVIQMRSLELCLNLSLTSATARDALASAGYIEEGMGALLAFDDPLSCLACWDLFAEMLSRSAREGNAARLSVLMEWLTPKIHHIVAALTTADPSLQSGILQVLSPILGHAIPSNEGLRQYFAQVVGLLLEIGEERSTNQDWLDVVLDCLGQLGRSAVGAEKLLLSFPSVLPLLMKHGLQGGTPPTLQITALQSIATLTTTPILSPEAEGELEKALSGERCVSALWHAMSNGVMEIRTSVYSCMTALGTRPWFVAQICQHPSLLQHLSNPKSELHAELSKSRYACLQAFHATASSGISPSRSVQAVLTEKLPILEGAVQQGPYGNGVCGAPSIPIVGTEFR